METFFIHLIKSSGILLLFLVCYHIFLKKETLFSGNRWFLVIGLVASLLSPFITFTKTIWVQSQPLSAVESSFINSEIIVETNATSLASNAIDWVSVLFIIYVVGIVFFGFRLLYQLFFIYRLKRNSNVVFDNQFYLVKTQQNISPFSFFKHIFYYPNQFEANELESILKHEKVHAREYHSLDILLLEIAIILLWFNPFIWLYKTAVKQNLEFLADSKSYDFGEGKKFYQYLMLKQVLNSGSLAIANPFYNSLTRRTLFNKLYPNGLVKKRIVMLNKKQSKKIKLLKAFLILPLLGIFLVAFNTKEIIRSTDPTEDFIESFSDDKPKFVSPIKHIDIKRITVDFGEATDPFTNKKRMHTGVDFKAAKGTTVMSTAQGTVLKTANSAGYGNYVVIEHSHGYSSRYMHLESYKVTVGDEVEAGTEIAAVGNTGRSTGPHLHFEILKDGKAIDPETVVQLRKETTAINTPQKVTALSWNDAPKQETKKEKFKFIITKSTTDEELEKIKSDLKQKEIDFSYAVVHNDADEIIDIALDIRSTSVEKNFNTVYNFSSDKPIAPIVLFYDNVTGGVSIGGIEKSIEVIKTGGTDEDIIIIGNDDMDDKHIEKHVRIISKHTDDDDIKIHSGKHKKLKIHTDSDKVIELKGEDGEIIEIKPDGHEVITIDKKGKHKKSIKYRLNTDDNEHTEIVILDKKQNVSVITPDGHEPLYFIDDKPATRNQVEKLKSKKIERIDVLKGDTEIEKYGKKARNGVVKIYTK